ncbi:MAG: adenylate kinase family protein [Thermoplasmatota archaeon]
MKPLRIALTGTPGVGKTTLAAHAGKALGWRVVDVKSWAHEAGHVVGYDAADDSAVVDVEGLGEEREWEGRPATTTLYEGHLSHLLPVDGAWVLRLDPAHLRPRLEGRGYPRAKVRENLEAEALDIILQECLDRFALVVQRDGSRRTIDETLTAFTSAGPGHDLEEVDWSAQMPFP